MAALISVLAELEKIGWAPIQPLSSDEIKTRCPMGHLHASGEDSSPSCTVNTEKLVFHCFACKSSGDFITFLAAALKTNRSTVFVDLAKRYDIEQAKPIEASVIEAEHTALWDQKHLLKELYLRGLTDNDVRKYRLGFASNRITIPIKNDGGVYVNVRYYLPGAPASEKFKNARGRGKPARPYPVEQLSYKSIALCGGEIKAIVAAKQLNKHDTGAVSFTAGEGAYTPQLLQRFIGKRVWMIMDIDEHGQRAASRLAMALRPLVEWIGIVRLPLDADKYPKGDINDFVAKENGNLWKIMEETPEWFPAISAPTLDENEEPQEKRFSETIMSENVGRRMKFDAVVSAAVDKPFVVPKRVLVSCDKSQEVCSICGVFATEDKTFHVKAESPAILQMIDVPQEKLDSAIRAALHIPKKCPVVQLSVEDHYNAWDVRINPSLDISNRDSDKTMQQAVCVECDADLNTTYKFTGRMYPHPKTQSATLLLSRGETTHDALSKYQPRDLPSLRVFRPAEWTLESLNERLDDIYEDLEVNVTKIFLRRDIHYVYDLAYHSPLILDVDGKRSKGWVEALVVGDTAHGKSETLEKMMQHYQLGEVVPCKNASVAGLLGGLKQIGTQWYMSWGIIPKHDRRIVALEELKGASVEVIASLTDMRSSGVAQTTKIEQRRTQARTRLIAVSNPRFNRKMSSYAFGVEAIRELIGAPEDIRRFDVALIVADGEIDPKELSRIVRDPPEKKHRYTSDLCKELILWGWTRLEKDIAIDRDASQLISDEASALCKEYSDEVPLVDRGSMRHKLSRLSAALACRTFSTGETELHLRVRLCHVQHIVAFLRRAYSSKVFGYKYYSDAVKVTTSMIDAPAIKIALQQMSHPAEVRDQLLYADHFDMQDLQDWTGLDKDMAQPVLSLFVRKRAVKRMGKKYIKTPEFIEFLKQAEFTKVPEHAKPEEVSSEPTQF